MNKTIKKEHTFSPKAVLKELKAVKWAKFKTQGKDIGVAKNTLIAIVSIAMFAGFFELCSLTYAALLQIGGM